MKTQHAQGKTYKTIVKTEYSTGIYDNCESKIESNGGRFRVTVEGVKWEGNTGGFKRWVKYFDREDGRKILKNVRKAQRAEIDPLKYGFTTVNDVLGWAVGL